MIKEEDDPIAFAAHRLASAYGIGQALDDLSIEEIGLRIDMLTQEIRRLEETREAKEASRASAAAFFKI
jgi:uncharacterized small protein (DUF1192 family)